jgi:hypothetical protein
MSTPYVPTQLVNGIKSGSDDALLPVVTYNATKSTLVDSTTDLPIPINIGGNALATGAVPVILPPNGTIAANGVVTLSAALNITYSSGAWVRFPAGAVVGGSSGLYWVIFSSTTVGQVYTNFRDPANVCIPNAASIPISPVAAVGSGVAYVTPISTDITLVNVTIPAGTLGLNGSIFHDEFVVHTASVNNKTYRIFFGGVSVSGLVSSFSSQSVGAIGTIIRNQGFGDSQICVNSGSSFLPFGLSGGVTYLTINTAANVTIALSARIESSAEFASIAGFTTMVRL